MRIATLLLCFVLLFEAQWLLSAKQSIHTRHSMVVAEKPLAASAGASVEAIVINQSWLQGGSGSRGYVTVEGY